MHIEDSAFYAHNMPPPLTTTTTALPPLHSKWGKYDCIGHADAQLILLVFCRAPVPSPMRVIICTLIIQGRIFSLKTSLTPQFYLWNLCQNNNSATFTFQVLVPSPMRMIICTRMGNMGHIFSVKLHYPGTIYIFLFWSSLIQSDSLLWSL